VLEVHHGRVSQYSASNSIKGEKKMKINEVKSYEQYLAGVAPLSEERQVIFKVSAKGSRMQITSKEPVFDLPGDAKKASTFVSKQIRRGVKHADMEGFDKEEIDSIYGEVDYHTVQGDKFAVVSNGEDEFLLVAPDTYTKDSLSSIVSKITF
jgi:hypothetical protein